MEIRLLTRKEAASYCGIGVSTFDKWVAAGRVPAALKGTRRWDRRALDAALDVASGLKGQSRSSWDTWRGRKGDARAP